MLRWFDDVCSEYNEVNEKAERESAERLSDFIETAKRIMIDY